MLDPTDSLLEKLLCRLDLLVLEALPKDRFRVLGQAPSWGQALIPSGANGNQPFELPKELVFLHNFLEDAREVWQGPESRPMSVESGPWVESTKNEELYLEATALTVDEKKLLVVTSLGEKYLERSDLLQKAREQSLMHQMFAGEMQKKEVLLHCIVHDFSSPLTAIKGVYDLLGRETLSETAERRIKLGREAVRRLESLVRSTLDVFAAELEALESFSVEASAAPDLVGCVRSAFELVTPVAVLGGAQLVTAPELETSEVLKVVGEKNRLERVLFNLLENALRHTPRGGKVCLRLKCDDSAVQVRIEDDGPGVPESQVPALFGRFSQGSGKKGKAGLGLYFCRIVVERWGGEVGYEPGPDKGAVFWFRLRRARAER